MATSLTLIAIILNANFAVGTARSELGNAWTLVLALDVINTAVVIFYLWRIWKKEPGSPSKREQI